MEFMRNTQIFPSIVGIGVQNGFFWVREGARRLSMSKSAIGVPTNPYKSLGVGVRSAFSRSIFVEY